jgi:hypothetical protein
MRTIARTAVALGFAGAVGVMSLAGGAPANAQGFYFNSPGIHIGVGHPWHRHYYARPYGSGYYDYGGGGNCYYNGCCPTGMTIQGGACRPYRGY